MVRKFITNTEFIKRVNKISNGEYTFIDSYKGSSTKLKVVHNLCGTVFECSPNKFKQGTRCPKRGLDKLIILCRYNNFEIVDNYKDYKTPITFKCLKHNKLFKTAPIHITSRKRKYFCEDCLYDAQSKNQLITTGEAKLKLQNKGIDYVLCDDYKGVHYYNLFRCPSCNNVFKAEFNSVIRGNWGCTNINCIRSKISKGEFYIKKYLDSKNIKYEPQKKFKDLKDKTYLSYDFYLPDYNILIEYQGKQHFESIRWGSTHTNYEKQLYHDNLKKYYAINNNYILLTPNYKLNTYEKVSSYLSKNIV